MKGEVVIIIRSINKKNGKKHTDNKKKETKEKGERKKEEKTERLERKKGATAMSG